MFPHRHLTEFNDDIANYQNVRLFCIVPGSMGMWQEQIVHRKGTIEDLLVLVKIRDRLYRYDSPEPLSVRMSQLEIAEVIRRKLISSLWFQIATRFGQILNP
jgi:hypothetical protein